LFGGRVFESVLWAQESRSPDADEGERAWGGTVRLPTDTLFVEVQHWNVEPDFNPGLGFVDRTGVRDTTYYARYRWRPEGGHWLAHNTRVLYREVTDQDGALESSLLRWEPWVPFSRGFDEYVVALIREREVLREPFALFGQIPIPVGDYTARRVHFTYIPNESRAATLNAQVGVGDFYNGDREFVSAGPSWRPSPHFALKGQMIWNRIRLPAGELIARVYSFNTTVAFNARWSWQTVVQYDSVSQRHGINARVRWLPHAGSEFYVILNTLGFRDDDGFGTDAQDLAVKFNYTFHF
jgi:hypothetical protein